DAEFVKQRLSYGSGATVYGHEGGMFPRIIVASGAGPEVREVAIKVESVSDFSRAHDLGLEPVGYAMVPYRFAPIPGEATSVSVVERRGYRGFEPFPGELAQNGRMAPQMAREALAARDLWLGRKRSYDDDAEGFDKTDELLDRIIERVGS